MARLITVLLLVALAGSRSAPGANEEGSSALSMLTTCSQLTSNYYPADTVNWFYPSKHSQIVFFAHLLFPLRPDLEAKRGPIDEPGSGPWHPPVTLAYQIGGAVEKDFHFVEAEWVGPDSQVIADFGQTLTPRASSEYLRLDTKNYIPHTFAMAIGTRDQRVASGQKELPSKKGLYHIRFYVDGHLQGISFFSILEGGDNKQPEPGKLEGGEGRPSSLTKAGKTF